MSESLLRARAAAGRGDWSDALALLVEVDTNESLARHDLELLANVAYAAGRLDLTIDAWERVHAEALRTGDQLAAANAALRVALHLLMDSALMSPIRGWMKRSEDLLDGHPESPVHAWLALVRGYERLFSGDTASALTWQRRAIELGTRLDPACAAVARVAEARAMIVEGAVSEGLAQLDAAGVAAVSGEVDAITAGIVYCEVLCGLQGLAQYERADQWTEAMERWSRASAIGSFPGRCRLHRAEILRLRGSCSEAAREAERALDELRPFVRRELGWPLTELGRIRLQQGDVDGAEEAFLAAHLAGWQAQPGLALVQLARGQAAEAAVAIRDALDRPSYIPSKEYPPNTELRRAPLLAAQVEIELAAGDQARAAAAAEEISAIAVRYESKALGATAAFVTGCVRLAAGAPDAARESLEHAIEAWSDIDAPYELAQARSRLAEALERQGLTERAALERNTARVLLQRTGAEPIGDGVPTSRIPVNAPSGETAEPMGGREVFRREGDTWELVFTGRRARVTDLKGLRYLARLLAQPGREIHAVELVIAEGGTIAADAHGAGPALDDRAKQVYRRRLAEIEADLEEARARSDLGRIAQAEAERARVSVTRAIRQALARIADHHPALAQHLGVSIRTGAYCVYQLDPATHITWHLDLT
jgi:tetratricopeptide (TPR) repeat protein